MGYVPGQGLFRLGLGLLRVKSAGKGTAVSAGEYFHLGIFHYKLLRQVINPLSAMHVI